MTDTMAKSPALLLREFIRANQRADGAMEASDALHEIEARLLDVTGERARESAYSAAIVRAQAEVNAAFKDKAAGNYKVAETEQLLVLCREVMIRHGLALEVGSSEVIVTAGQSMLRIHFGLRHELGFVRVVVRDFPVSAKAGAPDVAIRQANTSALGYFLRDAFALPRLKDEGEAAQAQASRSGPRRAATMSQPSAPPAEAQGSPAARAPSVTPEERLATALGAIGACKNFEAVERAQERVDGYRFDLTQGRACPFTAADLDAMALACSKRRMALEE